MAGASASPLAAVTRTVRTAGLGSSASLTFSSGLLRLHVVSLLGLNSWQRV